MPQTKILITGGAGFIASALAAKLIENPDYYVVMVDNLLTGDMNNLPGPAHSNWRFIKADVNVWTDIQPIMSAYSFNYVFHYAAVVGVKRTLKNPVMVLNDIQGVKNILDLCKSTGVQRVFFSSSSEVYGEPVEFPQNETTTPLNSRLPYAVVKNVGESFCRSYQREFDLDFTIFRFFNTYGPKQSTDFVMSRFLKAALRDRDITIYGKGDQTRTFCYIDDNVAACIASLEEDKIVNDVVNIGNDEEIAIIDLANAIIDITNSKSKLVYLPALKEGDMSRRKPDISKMRDLLKRDLIPMEEGIQKLIDSGKFN